MQANFVSRVNNRMQQQYACPASNSFAPNSSTDAVSAPLCPHGAQGSMQLPLQQVLVPVALNQAPQAGLRNPSPLHQLLTVVSPAQGLVELWTMTTSHAWSACQLLHKQALYTGPGQPSCIKVT